MIYLPNTTEAQVVFVPKPCAIPGGDLVFKAKSTIDLETEINQVVIDLNTSDQYFNLAVTLPGGIPDGEYEYTIMAGEIPVASGLLVIGDYNRPSEYIKDINYEQYTIE
jgi:hypothetical protein